MKRNEIGSSFEAPDKAIGETIFDYLKEYNSLYFDSGRSALRYLLKNSKPHKALLPSYICVSVFDCFEDCEVIYYNHSNDLVIDWKDLLLKIDDTVDLVYLHFFNGYISDSYDFEELKRKRKELGFLIIEDTTHSLFTSKLMVGDYALCSLRKWFPIPDGGVAYSKNNLSEFMMQSNDWHQEVYLAMKKKKDYLMGLDVNKDDFLSVFRKCEKDLDNQKEICLISPISLDILNEYSVNYVVENRLANSRILNKMLKRLVVPFAYKEKGQVPLFYTIHHNYRDSIRSSLTMKGIYCPIHWPLFSDIQNFSSSIFNEKYELSIPIDQRYDIFDMEYIVKVINEIKENE